VTALLIAFVVCGTVLYVTHEVSRIFASQRAADQRLADREATLREKYYQLDLDRFDAEQRKAVPPKGRSEMPSDLEAKINAWEDDWAREDERRAVLELYGEYGDWDLVRRKYSPALADAHAEQVI
jgi:hypothetical protein